MSIASIREKLGSNVVKHARANSSGSTGRMPGRVTILKHCRCIDCRHWTGWCRALVPASEPPEQWHWCARYSGPRISKQVFIWQYDTTPTLGPRGAIVANPTTGQTSGNTGQRGPPRVRQGEDGEKAF